MPVIVTSGSGSFVWPWLERSPDLRVVPVDSILTRTGDQRCKCVVARNPPSSGVVGNGNDRVVSLGIARVQRVPEGTAFGD